MAEFIIPPREGASDATIFLAGPVQGTHDWQREAATQLLDALPQPNVDIVSPRGLKELYAKPSPWLDTEQQTPWEKRHLLRAREQGCLAMWMAAQEFETPGRVFAQTSRIELGRIAGWIDYNPDVRFVFGIDPHYMGGNRTYFEQLLAEFSLPVHDNFQEWCAAIAEELH